MEQGVTVINGTSPPNSRASSPTSEEKKPKRFLNGWSKEQERLMAEWSDLAMCYRWLHDKSEKHYHSKTLWINLPVIILSTLGGTANFGIQSAFSDPTTKQYASFAIGGISLFAGLLTTIGNYLRYAQLEEANRVASIAWGKFQRLIAVELALKPDERMDSLDFLKICRSDLDRLIEQSPPIPELVIEMFEKDFGGIKELKKPDICGALEHTRVFESSDVRLKQVATDAALFLRHKKNALTELLSPQIQSTIKAQIDAQMSAALEERKKELEEQIEREKAEALRVEQEYQQAINERKRMIQAEIQDDMDKQKRSTSAPKLPSSTSKFESRMQFKQNPLFSDSRRTSLHDIPPIMVPLSPPLLSASQMQSESLLNIVVIPSSAPSEKHTQ